MRISDWSSDVGSSDLSPAGPLVWPLQGVETACMIGWHGVSVLAEAHAKGIEADYAAAWPNIRRRAFDRDFKDIDSTLGRDFYYDLGYIPCDEVWESVSRKIGRASGRGRVCK